MKEVIVIGVGLVLLSFGIALGISTGDKLVPERTLACKAKQGVEVRAADGSYICIFKGALLDVRT